MIRSPSRTGAATYITEVRSSFKSTRVVRAYWPRKVRYTSFQREKSRPRSRLNESKITMPRSSVI